VCARTHLGTLSLHLPPQLFNMALSLSLSAHPPLTLRSMAENMRYNVEVVGVAGMPRLDPDIRSLVSYLGSSACDFTGSYACTCVRARIEREREKEGLREGGREGGRERERCIQTKMHICTHACMHTYSNGSQGVPPSRFPPRARSRPQSGIKLVNFCIIFISQKKLITYV